MVVALPLPCTSLVHPNREHCTLPHHRRFDWCQCTHAPAFRLQLSFVHKCSLVHPHFEAAVAECFWLLWIPTPQSLSSSGAIALNSGVDQMNFPSLSDQADFTLFTTVLSSWLSVNMYADNRCCSRNDSRYADMWMNTHQFGSLAPQEQSGQETLAPHGCSSTNEPLFARQSQ